MNMEMPRHVAIIMDGNGRWAKRYHKPRYEGHRAGVEAVRRAVEFAIENGIKILTLFALSVENYKCRPAVEVQFLLSLFFDSLKNNRAKLHEKNIRIRIIGDDTQFNKSLIYQIQETESLTKNNTGLTLVLAINYSGRWDITQAARRLAKDIQSDCVDAKAVNEKQFSQYLCLSDLLEPDLLIRTSGELRMSNFMLWQFAYTELFFSQEYWPEFDATVFQRAIDAFIQRKRRFGHTSEQLEQIGA